MDTEIRIQLAVWHLANSQYHVFRMRGHHKTCLASNILMVITLKNILIVQKKNSSTRQSQITHVNVKKRWSVRFLPI
jgi:hypothetical protein